MKQLALRLTSTRGGARPGRGERSRRTRGRPTCGESAFHLASRCTLLSVSSEGSPACEARSLARTVMAQIGRARERFWRVVHFSVQATHLHLVVEVANERELGRAMQGLGVRIAKSVNRLLRRKGRRDCWPASCASSPHPTRSSQCDRVRYVQCAETRRSLVGLGSVVIGGLVRRVGHAAR